MANTPAVCPKCGKNVDFDGNLARCFCPACGRMVIRSDLSPAPSAEDARSMMSSGEVLLSEGRHAEAFAEWSAAIGSLSSKDFAVWRDKLPGLAAEVLTRDLMILQQDVQDGYADVCEVSKRRGFGFAGRAADVASGIPLTGRFNADFTGFLALAVMQAAAIEYARDAEEIYGRCRAVQDRYYDCRAALRDGEGKTLFAAKSMYNDAIRSFVFLGGLINGKTRRMSQKTKDALNALCAGTELPPEIRGLAVRAVGWQVRRMASPSLRENSRYKSNMKKDLRAFCEGYFGRFDY